MLLVVRSVGHRMTVPEHALSAVHRTVQSALAGQRIVAASHSLSLSQSTVKGVSGSGTGNAMPLQALLPSQTKVAAEEEALVGHNMLAYWHAFL